MHLDASDNGKLLGRVLSETLPGGVLPEVSSRVITSEPAANGLATVLDMQQIGSTRYFDAAGFPGRTVGLSITAVPGRRPSKYAPKAAENCGGAATPRRQANRE